MKAVNRGKQLADLYVDFVTEHIHKIQHLPVSLTLMAALLQHTRLMASQVGRSSRLWRTSSSSSRFVSWPSPFSVLRLILSGDRFFANLQDTEKRSSFEPENICKSRIVTKNRPAKQNSQLTLNNYRTQGCYCAR